MTSSNGVNSSARIWRWPIAIAVTSSLGLVAALIGDDAWDVFSWLTLAIPVAVTGLAWRRAVRGKTVMNAE